MIKTIKKWFAKRKLQKQVTKDFEQMSPEDILHVKNLISWLTTEEPSVYFRLNEEEVLYLKENYITPWEKANYDDSFTNWESNSPYNELNYLIKCFRGEHGFVKSQDAFDYMCRCHPPLLDFHQELARENILCGR